MIQKLETHYDQRRVNYGSGVRLQYDQIRKLIQSLPGRSGTSNEYNGRILVRVPKSVHAALAHEAEQEGDTRVTKNDVTLLIDPMSFQYLMGSEIDYQEGLEGSQFVIKNPNAKTSCGCRSSFSV